MTSRVGSSDRVAREDLYDLFFEQRPPSNDKARTQQRKECSPGRGFYSSKHSEAVTSLESSREQSE